MAAQSDTADRLTIRLGDLRPRIEQVARRIPTAPSISAVARTALEIGLAELERRAEPQTPVDQLITRGSR